MTACDSPGCSREIDETSEKNPGCVENPDWISLCLTGEKKWAGMDFFACPGKGRTVEPFNGVEQSRTSSKELAFGRLANQLKSWKPYAVLFCFV